jgi:UrcA family protein
MNSNLRTKLMTAMCLGYGMACFSAIAAAADEGPLSEVVRYGDLDISSSAGALTLYHRIQAAARRVCPEAIWDGHFFYNERACYQHAVDDAVTRIDSAALSRIHGNAMPRLASR